MSPAMRNDMATALRCALDQVAFAVERLDFTPDPWQAEVLRSSGRNILYASRLMISLISLTKGAVVPKLSWMGAIGIPYAPHAPTTLCSSAASSECIRLGAKPFTILLVFVSFPGMRSFILRMPSPRTTRT